MFKIHRLFACFFLLIFTSSILAEEAKLNLVLTNPPIAAVNTETAWLNIIENSQYSIDIASFFFNSAPRSSMEKIIRALLVAADRGVQIRILIDQSMRDNSQSTLQQLQNKNIQITATDFQGIAGGVMHAKYMIADEKIIFVGSQNFSWKAMAENHETGIEINNAKLATSLLSIFNLDWEQSSLSPTVLPKMKVEPTQPDLITEKTPLDIGNTVLFPAFSPQKSLRGNVSWELPVLLHLIQNAKKEIDIDVYQYSDLSGYQGRNHWTAIDDALIAATKRGVHVNLIISEAMLNRKAGFKGLGALRDIPNLKIKISSLQPLKSKKKIYTRVDHSKFMIIDDDISWIGTGNWEKSYFYNSRDVALIIYNKNLHEQLKSTFFAFWNGDEIREMPQ
jgi:phospholipase D3/4